MLNRVFNGLKLISNGVKRFQTVLKGVKRLFKGFSAVNIAGPADTSIPRGKKAKTDEGLNCTKCPMGYPKYPIFETAVQGFFCGEYCGTKHSMWE